MKGKPRTMMISTSSTSRLAPLAVGEGVIYLRIFALFIGEYNCITYY